MTQRIGVFGLTSRRSHAQATLHLGAGFALARHTALIIDLGVRGGLSELLGLPTSDASALTSLLLGEAPPEDLGLLVRTADVGLDIVPGCSALETVRELDPEPLDAAIRGLNELYGAVILHCPGRANNLRGAVRAVCSRSLVHLGAHENEATLLEQERLWRGLDPSPGSSILDFLVEGRLPGSRSAGQDRERWHLVPAPSEDPNDSHGAFDNEMVIRPEAWVYGNLARELLYGD